MKTSSVARALCSLLLALLVVQAPVLGQGAAAAPRHAPKFKGKAPVSNEV